MIYAEILAGGKGTRMGTTSKPKQFIELDGKPILIYTIEAFLKNKNIDRIIVCLPKTWIKDFEKILAKFIKKDKLEKIFLVEGGLDRQSSLLNGCYFIKEKFGINNIDIVLTHDGVRPFISQLIIDENIKAAKKYAAIDTVIPAIDTIVQSKDNEIIKSIPDRSQLYYGQSPQTFNIKKLLSVFEKLTKKEKEILTDACKAFVLKGEKVALVKGDYSNIKITTPFDLTIAKSFLKTNKKIYLAHSLNKVTPKRIKRSKR